MDRVDLRQDLLFFYGFSRDSSKRESLIVIVLIEGNMKLVVQQIGSDSKLESARQLWRV